MIHKLAVLSALIISVFCSVHPGLYPLHQIPQYPHSDNVNYNFAYEVNHPPTGDIKSQQESRRGDTVIGQYSLLQPDGHRRIVDYTSDNLRGFRAKVNNDGATITKQRDDNKQTQRDGNKQRDDEEIKRNENSQEPKRDNSVGKTEQETPQWSIKDAPPSVAISRTSLFQIIRQNPQPYSNGWD